MTSRGTCRSAPRRRPAAAENGAIGRIRSFVWFFIAVALLTLPLFAHGCHGDDVDHEPLLVPLRSNPEDR